MEKCEQQWNDKIAEEGLITSEDLEPLVKLFENNSKKFKEKYGKYCINRPMSDLIITEFNTYFNVNIQNDFVSFA